MKRLLSALLVWCLLLSCASAFAIATPRAIPVLAQEDIPATPHGIRNYLRVPLFVFNPVSPHQQTVRIDAVRSTSEKCTVILAFDNFQKLGFIGCYCFNINNFIGKDTVENVNIKNLAFLHLVKFCKHIGRRETCVTCNNAVSTFSADRQRGIFKRTTAFPENLVCCAVINRKINAD